MTRLDCELDSLEAYIDKVDRKTVVPMAMILKEKRIIKNILRDHAKTGVTQAQKDRLHACSQRIRGHHVRHNEEVARRRAWPT